MDRERSSLEGVWPVPPSSVQMLGEMLFTDRCSWEWGAQMGRDTFFSLSFFPLELFALYWGIDD